MVLRALPPRLGRDPGSVHDYKSYQTHEATTQLSVSVVQWLSHSLNMWKVPHSKLDGNTKKSLVFFSLSRTVSVNLFTSVICLWNLRAYMFEYFFYFYTYSCLFSFLTRSLQPIQSRPRGLWYQKVVDVFGALLQRTYERDGLKGNKRQEGHATTHEILKSASRHELEIYGGSQAGQGKVLSGKTQWW